MTLSIDTRVTTSLYLSITLAISQVLTVTALVILFKAFLKLRNKVIEHEKNVSHMQQDTSPCEENNATATGTSVSWLQTGEESPTRVPTPSPNRRCKQQATAARTQSTGSSSCEMTEMFRDISFISSATPRDSGTGSMTVRTPQGSISYESKSEGMQDLLSKRNTNSTPSTNRLSRESQGSLSPIDMSRDTTRGFQKKSFGPQKGAPIPPEDFHSLEQECHESKNQNEVGDRLSSRSQTMHIGMIMIDENSAGEKKDQRRFSEKQVTLDAKPSVVNNAHYENEGYNGDHDASNQGSTVFSKKLAIDSDEMANNLNSRFIRININDDYEQEKYVNQAAVEAMRCDSVESSTAEGPLYQNLNEFSFLTQF